MVPNILVVEDEPAIAESVAYALRRDGFTASVSGTVAAARAKLAEADLIVLDLMLPDGSGFDLVLALRAARRPTPVIVLSSRDAEADRIAALEAGADDYVTKPFSPREVVARVRAVLRRVGNTSMSTELAPALQLNPDTRRAEVGGQTLELTRVEFDLLARLLERPGNVYSRAQLIDAVWGSGFAITDRTIDSHIKAVRRKLGEAGADPGVVETVRGVGYRVVLPAPSATASVDIES